MYVCIRRPNKYEFFPLAQQQWVTDEKSRNNIRFNCSFSFHHLYYLIVRACLCMCACVTTLRLSRHHFVFIFAYNDWLQLNLFSLLVTVLALFNFLFPIYNIPEWIILLYHCCNLYCSLLAFWLSAHMHTIYIIYNIIFNYIQVSRWCLDK